MDPVSTEMEGVFLTHRSAILTFLSRLGAGNGAEDLLQDMWLRLPREGVPIRAPRAYLFRMAHSLFIDRERSLKQGTRRDAIWSQVTGPSIPDRSEHPNADRQLEARETADQAFQIVAEQGARAARVFHRHRIDGLTQREVAAELSISIGTVEGDLRRVYAALIKFREQHNGG